MRNTTKADRIVAGIFVTIIFIFFFAIVIRFGTKQILIKRFGMSNMIVDTILFDAPSLKSKEEEVLNIYWDECFPFVPDTQEADIRKRKKLLQRYTDKVFGIERKLEPYTTTVLPGHIKIAELSNSIKMFLRWNLLAYTEYNGITQIEGQYLAQWIAQKDISEMVKETIDLAKYCEEKNINFLYAEQPSKICVYEDEDISGSVDFSNQNMDAFLQKLKANGVDTYDHRADIHTEGLNHHSLFYCTDHHWKAETGLWAAQHLLAYMNKQYGYSFDSGLLNADNYTYDVYPDWFLGSQGKKATLSLVDPENITLIHPKFETKFQYTIPEIGLDEEGSFDITYDMRHIEEKDYYNKNPYAAYDYADHALIKIENKMISDGPKVLIVHHSFANCEIPFLALGMKQIDAIDLRHFNGSLKSYIEQSRPDIVVVTYNFVNESIDRLSHGDILDFR